MPTADEGALPLHVAAELQDHLLVAGHDLDRLQRLLDDATQTLSTCFYTANHLLTTGTTIDVQRQLSEALTALQFHDMSTQLIAHTQRRLRGLADRIARDAMDDDEDGAAVVCEIPNRPNPVTQDEVDAGSIELF
ncbi:MAG: hypothetical protein LCH73_15575 [Proteobacteria bacterium]|nr:hypothetical protein [Pseudomonadota bacterium]